MKNMSTKEGFTGLQKMCLITLGGGLAGLLFKGTEHSSNSTVMDYAQRTTDYLNSAQDYPAIIGNGLVLGAAILAPFLLYKAFSKKK